MTIKMVPNGAIAENGNTEHSPRNNAYRYCFTFNNYNTFGIDGSNIYTILKKICKKFIFQEEVGEMGTPHLQGSIWLIKKERITALKKIIHNTIHWEPMRNEKASIDYCSNEDKRNGKVWSFGFPKPIIIIKDLYKWQQSIVNLVELEASKRNIIWIYDEKGNNGKTELMKYLVHKKQAVFSYGGKCSDIINLAFNNKEYLECSDKPIMIYNFGRDICNENISYKSMEQIKDGCISNNKYECGCFIFNSPHILVFANCLPRRRALTDDRIKIYTIFNEELLIYNPMDES